MHCTTWIIKLTRKLAAHDWALQLDVWDESSLIRRNFCSCIQIQISLKPWPIKLLWMGSLKPVKGQFSIHWSVSYSLVFVFKDVIKFYWSDFGNADIKSVISSMLVDIATHHMIVLMSRTWHAMLSPVNHGRSLNTSLKTSPGLRNQCWDHIFKVLLLSWSHFGWGQGFFCQDHSCSDSVVTLFSTTNVSLSLTHFGSCDVIQKL